MVVGLAVSPAGVNVTLPAPRTLLHTKLGVPASRSVTTGVTTVLLDGRVITAGLAAAVRDLKWLRTGGLESFSMVAMAAVSLLVRLVKRVPTLTEPSAANWGRWSRHL